MKLEEVRYELDKNKLHVNPELLTVQHLPALPYPRSQRVAKSLAMMMKANPEMSSTHSS